MKQNNYKISNIGYFIYCNSIRSKKTFDAKLEFDVTLIPYEGNDDWVEEKIIEAHKCLNNDNIPEPGYDCDYCSYINSAKKFY